MDANVRQAEADRLAEVRGLEQLDTAPDPALDAVTRLAASICDVPIALITLVDEQRQWFKSSVGLTIRETPRDQSFCTYAILQPHAMMVVRDATQDPRFMDNPLVTRDPHIRFYAGVPLVSEGGHGLGTLCAIDRTPRTLSPLQKRQLQDLATIVVPLLDTTRTVRRMLKVTALLDRAITAELAASQRVRSSEAQMRTIIESIPDAIISVDREGRLTRYNSQFAADVRRAYGIDVANGMYLFEIGDATTRAAAVANHARVLRGESLRFEWSALEADGRPIHYMISHAPMVVDGEVQGAAILVKNITERRVIELALARKNVELDLLRAVATTANEALTSEDAITQLLALVGRFGNWAIGHAYALVGNELVSTDSWYFEDASARERRHVPSSPIRVRAGVGVPGRVLATGRPVFARFLEDHPAFMHGALVAQVQLRSAFAFPVFVKDEVVAVLEFFADRAERPNEQLTALLDDVGRQVGRVIERERHAAEVRELSLTDELTGLGNRRAFMTLAAHHLRVAARNHTATALLAADLDGLKRINDELGHAAGDEAIATFAGILRKTFRRDDVVARLGGDEFAVVMTVTSTGTREVRARLQRHLDAANAQRPAAVALAVSIGVVDIPADGTDSLEVILARADAAMYEQKRLRKRGPT